MSKRIIICPKCDYPNPTHLTHCFRCKHDLSISKPNIYKDIEYCIYNENEENSLYYTTDEINNLRINGNITKDTLILRKDETTPKPAGSLFNFNSAVNEAFDLEINDSGKGAIAKLPEIINSLCWGGFLLPYAWGYGNIIKNKYIYLATCSLWIIGWFIMLFIDNIDLIMNISIVFIILNVCSAILSFIFLIKGHEMAWKSKEFSSINNFIEKQNMWFYIGLVAWVLFIIFVVATGISNIVSFFSHLYNVFESFRL